MKAALVNSLYLKYAVDLKRFITFKFRSAPDAEDIVHDTFHNILGVENLEEIDNPRAYLYQTACNLALNRIRKHSQHSKYTQVVEEPEAAPPPENAVLARKDLLRLERAVERLPPKWRRAFLLSRVEHKSYKEIADEVGISVSTVEKHIIGALRQLNDELDRQYDE